MAIPTSINVPLNVASIPPWATTLTNTINAVLNANWNAGQRTKTGTITAAMLGLADFPSNAYDLLNGMLNEYRAGNTWIVTILGSTTATSGRADSFTLEFARWPA